jgi:hypothetical protein
MNFEQITIRLGVDATAVTAGLGKVGNYVKGWGVSLVSAMKSQLGSLIGAGMFLESLNKVKEKILEISRVSRETGASTNFVQGMMMKAAEVGADFNQMAAGIAKFNKLLGQAKMGSVGALKTLSDMHVLTDKNSISNLKFADAMHNLAIRFDQLNDKQKQAYLLSQAFGKGYTALTPVFEGGAKEVDELSDGNFFTKINPQVISDYAAAWKGLKIAGMGVLATFANLTGRRALLAGPIIDKMKSLDKRTSEEKDLQNIADQEGISIGQEKVKILEEQAKLLEQQAELSATIADRDKDSVETLAQESRKILGLKGPLLQAHTVTPRMRQALSIETLEERAKLAWRRGDDASSARFQSQADQLRSASPWLKRADQNPMLKTESELSRVNAQLAPISAAAALIKE